MEKIQELTEKIYREGVEKGQVEGQRLIEEARKQAAQIVADAKTEAETIVTEAQKAARETDEHTKAELKMYAGQAVNALKSEVTTMVCDKITSEAVGQLTSDKDFLGRFLVELAGKWAGGEPVHIAASDADALKAYFASHAKALLDKGVTINKVNGKNTLFTIAPADGSYKVNFGTEEFENYLKDFLRPQLRDMLF